jgi:hypothetical protein
LLLRDQCWHLLHPELGKLLRSTAIAPLPVPSPRRKSVSLFETGNELVGTEERVWIPPELCPLLGGHCPKGFAREQFRDVQIIGEDLSVISASSWSVKSRLCRPWFTFQFQGRQELSSAHFLRHLSSVLLEMFAIGMTNRT